MNWMTNEREAPGPIYVLINQHGVLMEDRSFSDANEAARMAEAYTDFEDRFQAVEVAPVVREPAAPSTEPAQPVEAVFGELERSLLDQIRILTKQRDEARAALAHPRPTGDVTPELIQAFREGFGKTKDYAPTGEQAGEVVAVLDRALGDVMHAQCAMANGKPCDYLESDPKEISATISKLATPPRAVRVPDGPLTGKYADVLVPFVALMERELHANAGKGDRPGWLSMTRKVAVLEIHHHVAKLQKAVLNFDTAGVREYAADVANMSMMAVDVCGALIDAAPAPGKGGEA